MSSFLETAPSVIYYLLRFTIFAGTPASVILSSGKSLVTTAFAPIFTLLPITTGLMILAPGPMKQLLPILTFAPAMPPLILTAEWIVQFFPI